MTSTAHSWPVTFQIQQFLALAKPRVVALIVLTALIGMFLASPGVVALQPLVFGAIGVALVAGAPKRSSYDRQ
jgi:protoheme IX farnesyltransferase